MDDRLPTPSEIKKRTQRIIAESDAVAAQTKHLIAVSWMSLKEQKKKPWYKRLFRS